MEVVRKDWEESFLLYPASRTTKYCSHGPKCLAVGIWGKPLVEFRTPSGNHHKNMCLVCLREDVFKQYLLAITGDRGADTIIHPWANSKDDYHEDSFLLTPRMSKEKETPFFGIVAPFVRIPISCYKKTATGIVQSIDSDRIAYNIHYGGALNLRPKLYDPLRFKTLYDASFLILCSGLFVPPQKKQDENVTMINHCLFNSTHTLNTNPLLENFQEQGWTLHQAIVFFVEDDATLLEYVRSIHPQWDSFAKNPYHELKMVVTNFWDRLYDRYKNHNIDGVTIEPSETLQNLGNLWKSYTHNPINTRIDNNPAIAKILIERHQQHSNRKIPLPFNLHSPQQNHYFICKKCEVIKALTEISNAAAMKRKKKQRRHNQRKGLKRQGTNEIVWNIFTNKYHCFRKRSGGRKAVRNFYNRQKTGHFNCEEIVHSVLFGRDIVHVKGIAHACCTKCSFICYLNNQWILNEGKCPKCCKEKTESIRCMACGVNKNTNSKVMNWIYLDTFVDGGERPVERKWFCGRHTKALENIDRGIWSSVALYRHIMHLKNIIML
jgi:hypothetical protein